MRVLAFAMLGLIASSAAAGEIIPLAVGPETPIRSLHTDIATRHAWAAFITSPSGLDLDATPAHALRLPDAPAMGGAWRRVPGASRPEYTRLIEAVHEGLSIEHDLSLSIDDALLAGPYSGMPPRKPEPENEHALLIVPLPASAWVGVIGMLGAGAAAWARRRDLVTSPRVSRRAWRAHPFA